MDGKTFISELGQRINNPAGAVLLLSSFLEMVKTEAGKTNGLAFPGVGTFQGVKHEEHIVNDLSSGKRLLLPPSIELTFNPSGVLKKRVKEADL